MLLAPSAASAQDRTLSLYNTHTHERLTVTYKRNGRFIQAGLNQLNRFLRDWRRDEVARIDPELFDLVWQVYQDVGAREPIHLVSGYRSPTTNNMLRRRSSGVAQNSQHTQGRAMDFFIPGVQASRIRAAGLRLHGGGVGYYPGSRTPFVHLDTGSIRMWPRMTRSQLARVFPNGQTVHVPSDGQRMAGFDVVQRQLQRGGGGSPRTAVASNTAVSATTGNNDDDSSAMMAPPQSGSGGNVLATLFGGGAPTPPEPVASAPAVTPAPAPEPQAPPATASVEVAAVEPDEGLPSERDPFDPPMPIVPPNASGDDSLGTPALAGADIPLPVPAPTLDEIQIAAAATASPIITGAAPLDVPADAPVVPPVTRDALIARTVPAPGQIAAIIEARFAEQRALEASLERQVDVAIGTPETQTANALVPEQPQTDTAALAAVEDAVEDGNAELIALASTPRFDAPIPVPRPETAAETVVAVQTDPVVQEPSNASASGPATAAIATAFATAQTAQTPAQAAIANLAGEAQGSGGITGQLYPIQDDLWPALTKVSIRGPQHGTLIAPGSSITLSAPVTSSGGFLVDRSDALLQPDGFR